MAQQMNTIHEQAQKTGEEAAQKNNEKVEGAIFQLEGRFNRFRETQAGQISEMKNH